MNTHEVFNQAEPLADVNLWRIHPALRQALQAQLVAARGAGAGDPVAAAEEDEATQQALDTLGAEAGSAGMREHARLANLHLPRLQTHDARGRRVDQVEFHPSYHVLLGAAMRHGLHGTPWAGSGAQTGRHLRRAAAFMLFTELESSVLCPVSMTYAAAPALRANPALHALFGPKLAATAYDGRFVSAAQKAAVTMGMGMTEKQGGSDVRANTTRAVFDGDDTWGRRHRLTGHKWFMSAPMCDAFLVLARSAGAGSGALSCFFVPRFTPDGQVNPIRFQRLKDKLGNHGNASSEVEFDETLGWQVGDEGRGIAQILEMGTLTRLDTALGTAGLMRAALTIALHHTRQRSAFGRPLAQQPLMKNVLADLALESEAAMLLALRLARAVDCTEQGRDPDGHEALMRRVLTPITKFWVCKRGSLFAQEAMECLGGNGYVEEGGHGTLARIYREMPLNSIWEGAGNIMALDLLRALRTGAVVDALMHESQDARRAHPALARLAERLAHKLDGANGAEGEAQARRLARDVALLMQGTQLHAVAPAESVHAFCDSRITGASDALGLLGPRAALDLLIERAWPRDLT